MASMRSSVFALTLLFLPACGGDVGPVEPGAGPVQLRLENRTGRQLDSATVHTLDGPRTFGGLRSGVTSAYTAVSAAYRLATTDAFFPDTIMRLQVIDFVGETLVPPGRYTYVLSLFEDTNGQRRLGQEFRED